MQRPEPMSVLLEPDIPQHPSRLADELSKSRLPRVEELLLGCVPGPIGATSKAVIILLGLILMYRRISWWTMGLGGVLAAMVMVACLPVRVHDHWTLLAVQIRQMGLSLGFVYVGYFILAGPLLWILLILAPSTAPMSSRGRVYYGIIIGAGVILAIWLAGSWSGGYIALLVASIFTRPLDALQRSPMLSVR
jgi:Na+-transporting NADH:ubiquinone oxidoreductase subunit B